MLIARGLIAATFALTLTAASCGKKDTAAAPTPPAGHPDAVLASTGDTAEPRTSGHAPTAEPDRAKAPAGGAAGSAPAVTPIRLWHAYRGAEKSAFEQLIASFNDANSHISVTAQAVPYDAFVDKITIVVPRGQGPDLFVFAHNMVGSWVDKGVIAPIGDKVPSAALRAFIPQSVKALVYRRNLYGLPLAFKSLVLFCNKALLAEPPPTMEALIAALKPKMTQGRYGLLYEAGGLYQHATWIHAFGGSVFDATHKPAFATEAQARALRFARALFAKHKLYPKGVAEHMITTLFNEQKAICTLNGPWFRAEISDKVDYVVATIPSVEGKPGRPFLGIEALFVTTSSKHPRQAVEVARYLTGAEAAKVRLEVGKQPVAHAATLAASTDPHMAVFRRQADQSVLMDSSPDMQVVWATADSAIGRTLFVSGAVPAQELAKAQKRIEADLARRSK